MKHTSAKTVRTTQGTGRAFRIRSLFACVLLFAVILGLWRVYPVVGIRLEEGMVVFQMADHYRSELLMKDPYFREMTGQPDVFLHDAYVALPLHMVAIAVALVTACTLAVLWFRARARRLAVNKQPTETM